MPYDFPAQRLIAYRLCREVLVDFVAIEGRWPRGWADLRDQGKRSTTSVLLNLAEGASQPMDGRAKGRHYAIALASLGESAAVVDAASALKLSDRKELAELEEKMKRLGALIGGLLRRARKR